MPSSARSRQFRNLQGKPPRSWESPGLTETEETLDLLRLNGIEYVARLGDRRSAAGHRHASRHHHHNPLFGQETNDIVIHALQHLPSEQFLKRCTDQFDRLYLEGASNARIMAISIHPYITGVPHRIKYLEALLDLCPRSRRRRTDDGQRDWRLVSRRDGEELKLRIYRWSASRPASFGDPLTRTRCRRRQ